MFGSIGMSELILIFTIALIVFGPRRLPEIGRSLGKMMAEFRKATSELQTRLEDEVKDIEKTEKADKTEQETPAAGEPRAAEGEQQERAS